MIKLLDNKEREKIEYKMKVCAMLSEIAIVHGAFNCNDEIVYRYWHYPEYVPPVSRLRKIVSLKNIKWYIRNFIEVQDTIWNADFLRGLTRYGKIKNGKIGFPTFYWFNNEEIEEILEFAPFFGKKSYAWERKDHRFKGHYMWRTVPALMLKYSDKSISFMAGVLATGKVEQKAKRRKKDKDEIVYARYNLKIEPLLKQWNIPIEKKSQFGVYISPFWVALFTPWMPSCCQKWNNFKTAYKAKDYALIMWKVFTNKDIRTKGIPYLISRRAYYKNYGSIKGLERRWVDEKLVEIDSRVKDAVRYWDANISVKNQMED
jgi:hypothetical protein